MDWLRARVTRFAGIWLVAQLAIVVCVQSTIYASGLTQRAVTVDCGCAGRTMCPMHRGRPTPVKRTSDAACVWQGTGDPLGAVIVSLLGPAAVVPPPAVPFVPSSARTTLTRTDGVAFDVVRVPDSPPPRA